MNDAPEPPPHGAQRRRARPAHRLRSRALGLGRRLGRVGQDQGADRPGAAAAAAGGPEADRILCLTFTRPRRPRWRRASPAGWATGRWRRSRSWTPSWPRSAPCRGRGAAPPRPRAVRRGAGAARRDADLDHPRLLPVAAARLPAGSRAAAAIQRAGGHGRRAAAGRGAGSRAGRRAGGAGRWRCWPGWSAPTTSRSRRRADARARPAGAQRCAPATARRGLRLRLAQLLGGGGRGPVEPLAEAAAPRAGCASAGRRRRCWTARTRPAARRPRDRAPGWRRPPDRDALRRKRSGLFLTEKGTPRKALDQGTRRSRREIGAPAPRPSGCELASAAAWSSDRGAAGPGRPGAATLSRRASAAPALLDYDDLIAAAHAC